MNARSVCFTGPGEVSIREREARTPDAGEVRVRTEVSAISPGTELLVYRGQAPSGMDADESIDALSGTLEYPLRYGYAAVGVVEATGSEVDETWDNQRVFAFHPHESAFCVPPDELFPVPDDHDPETAALLANAEAAITFALDGTPKIGERVAVFGQGLVGLLTTALLAKFPLGRLVTIDGIERRRRLSRTLGAEACLSPGADVGAHLDGNGSDGADLAYELSGNPAALDAAIDSTGYAGRVVIGSWYGGKRVELDLGREFHRSRIRLRSSQVSTIDPEHAGRWTKDRRLEAAWDALSGIDASRLLTHRIPIERAESAYRLLDERPEEGVGIVLTYD